MSKVCRFDRYGSSAWPILKLLYITQLHLTNQDQSNRNLICLWWHDCSTRIPGRLQKWEKTENVKKNVEMIEIS